MSQEAAEPPEAPPDPHNVVGEHPDAAPPLESEQQQREDAAQALRDMIEKDEAETAAAEAEANGEPQGASEEPSPDKDEEGADADERPAEGVEGALDTDKEAAAQDKRREKPSNIREAMRRQKAARRDREVVDREKAELEQGQAALKREQEDFRGFMEKFRIDPIGAMSRHLNLPPEQLLAQQADAQVNQVPAAVQAQLDAQAQELAEYKASNEKQAADRAEAERSQNYQTAVANDVAYIAGVAEREGDAERYPYYASLSQPTKDRRALSILRYTVENMENPKQYTPDDLLEALDEQAKEDHSSLASSKFLAKQTDADRGQETPAPGAKTPRRRRGGPSARGAAEPAPARQPQTEAEAVEAAAAEVRRLHKKDADEREANG